MHSLYKCSCSERFSGILTAKFSSNDLWSARFMQWNYFRESRDYLNEHKGIQVHFSF